MLTLNKDQFITKMQIANLMFSSTPPMIQFGLFQGTVQSVQREDGSGRSFNITVAGTFQSKVFNVRTID